MKHNRKQEHEIEFNNKKKGKEKSKQRHVQKFETEHLLSVKMNEGI